jgi:hypothetical protein
MKRNRSESSPQNKIQTADVKDEKKRKISINMGIDFGTSYTKICFSDRIDAFYFVKFEGEEYKQSIIYFDYKNEILHYRKPLKEDNIEKIEYFKYSMIDDSLTGSKKLSSLKLNVKPPEILCSLFFLVCIIDESKEYVRNHFMKSLGNIEIEWSITMGVPIEKYENENHQLYDRLLNIANKMSSNQNNYSISIKDLDIYYQKNKDISLPRFQESNINTLPELYAESLAFLQSRNVDTGVYAIVDIGGATVDMAMMFKEIREDITRFSIVSRNIKPLGIEIVANNIVCDKKDIEQARGEMRNQKNILDQRYFSSERDYKEKFKEAFASIVVDLKKKNVHINFKHVLDNDNTLPVIICGGGANFRWYEDGILQTRGQLRNIIAGGLKLEIRPVEKLLPKHIKNHRLLIAYTLALPVEKIPRLDGYPWYFGEIDNGSPERVISDRYGKGIEKQKNIYGNDY